jgi:uncharacterized protein YegP (UPF0339 family)
MATREVTMAAKYEWFRDKNGKYRFHLKAPNGEIIAASEAYDTKDACLKGIESVKKHAATGDTREITQ